MENEALVKIWANEELTEEQKVAMSNRIMQEVKEREAEREKIGLVWRREFLKHVYEPAYVNGWDDKKIQEEYEKMLANYPSKVEEIGKQMQEEEVEWKRSFFKSLYALEGLELYPEEIDELDHEQLGEKYKILKENHLQALKKAEEELLEDHKAGKMKASEWEKEFLSTPFFEGQHDKYPELVIPKMENSDEYKKEILKRVTKELEKVKNMSPSEIKRKYENLEKYYPKQSEVLLKMERDEKHKGVEWRKEFLKHIYDPQVVDSWTLDRIEEEYKKYVKDNPERMEEIAKQMQEEAKEREASKKESAGEEGTDTPSDEPGEKEETENTPVEDEPDKGDDPKEDDPETIATIGSNHLKDDGKGKQKPSKIKQAAEWLKNKINTKNGKIVLAVTAGIVAVAGVATVLLGPMGLGLVAAGGAAALAKKQFDKGKGR